MSRQRYRWNISLIELMIIGMIIAVIIAIAVPSFLGFRASAQDRHTQSELREVLLVQRAYRLDTGEFASAGHELEAFDSAIEVEFRVGDPEDGVVLSLAEGGQAVCMTRVSDSGDVFAIWESAAEDTHYGKADYSVETCPTVAAELVDNLKTRGW